MEELTKNPPEQQVTKEEIQFSRIKRKFLKHVWLARASIIAIALLGIYLVILAGRAISEKTGTSVYTEPVKAFILGDTDALKSSEGRTNILVLGRGGEGHEAPDLTDSIMLVSVSLDRPSIIMLSLPRDIWVPAIRAKLNSAYYWGNQKQPDNGGLVLAKATVEEIAGVPVHYATVFDFSLFVNFIDFLGGVDVNVERGFVDKKYPIQGKENDLCGGDPEYQCRYETVSFAQGIQHMDGATALKYVRSRNADGDEGTDFAREARQQRVTVAIQAKMVKIIPQLLFSPTRVVEFREVFLKSLATDLSPTELAIIARRAFDGRDSRRNLVLPEDLLINPPVGPRYDNQYVFVPKTGDWKEVQNWIKEKLQ